MRLLIANTDYSPALDAAHPLAIERTLNAPSVCELWLLLPPDNSLAAPQRFQPVTIVADSGSVYFTGYIAAAPLPEYAGLALDGPRYRLAVRAVSDEILMDQALASSARSCTSLTAGAALANLAASAGSAALSAASIECDGPIGQFTTAPGAPFSKSAGELAAQARAAYRAQSGALTLSSIPAAVHELAESAGTIALTNLVFSRNHARNLANDITVCGEREPTAYITEMFQGDGLATSFDLSAAPFFPPTRDAVLISESFDTPAIDTASWSNPSGATYFSLGAGGLQMDGGSGIEGQTVLSWRDPVEMGGTLLLEAEGLTLANASTGILAAFVPLGQPADVCVAGFSASAQQGSGAVSLQPLVNGAASGPTYAINPDYQYTLRIRVHCPEPVRALAAYRSCGDSGPLTTGGQFILAGGRLQFEIQEIVNGVAGMPVVLYEGTVNSFPAACTIVAADSLNLHGSLRGLHLENLGSAWIVSTAPGASARTRRMGSAAQAAECLVERTGRLAFYTGFTPVPGEQITVTYRAAGQAVGRAANTASQQALAQQGLPPIAAWIGTVTRPAARTSADCRNAAAALGAAAASANALLSGTYRCTNYDLDSDVWPGDALALKVPSCNLDAQVVVRSVKISARATVPDVFAYEIGFANDWAEDLAIRTSPHVPADLWLPASPSPSFAANLNHLTITGLNGDTVTVNTGAIAPPGGGFEIRSRDNGFMPGEDASLVLRGSQPNLAFTRVSAADRFFIRMFDAASPPNYSEFSAAVILNLPIGS